MHFRIRLILVQALAKFLKMFLDLLLNYLSVTFLQPPEVAVCLGELSRAVEKERLRLPDLRLDVGDNLRYLAHLISLQLSLVNALRT